MDRKEAIKLFRRDIECLSHDKCSDCILEKACDPMKTPPDSEYIEAYGMAIEALSAEPCEDVAKERYKDLCEYFGEANAVLASREEFKKWLERVKWHVRKADELAREQERRTEPCEDAISRQAAIDAAIDGADDWDGGYNPTREEYIKKAINALPSVTPQKMGRWEYTGSFDEDGMLECSVCGREVDPSCYHYKFCPMCGAKMESEEV